MTNFSGSTKVIDFGFVAEAIESADRTAKFSLTLPAGAQRIIPEIVEDLRRQGVAGVAPAGQTFAGAAFVTTRRGDLSGVVIGARTGSRGGGGQYSVFYNAVPDGAGFSDTAWIDALQQNEENRSNLALVNTGEVDGGDSVFQLDLYNGATGGLANTVTGLRVAAKGWRQISGILDQYAPGATQGYVRIRKISGNNPFLAYGVINDGGAPGQRSGDGAYLPASGARKGIDEPGTSPATDREALVALYNATDGPNWRNAENWLTDAPLWKWSGVFTDASGRVHWLDLSGRGGRPHGLTGPIPPELGNLAHLEVLDLPNNDLTGPIPPEIGNLDRLFQLTLSNNNLSGQIPSEIGNLIRLEGLGLFHNNFDGGPIPLEFGNLVRLERLLLDVRHCAPPGLLTWLSERRLDILPCTDPGGRLLPRAMLREDSGGLSLRLDDDLRDPLAVTVSDPAVVTASVQNGWLVLSPLGIGEADVEIAPSGGATTATATVVVRAAVGTFGIDIVMEQPATELYAETITAAADWWSSALNGTEWEGRDAREHCDHWENNVPVAAKGNDLVIWAQRETDPSYSAGATGWSCPRLEGPETEPSHYYPVAGIVTTNARVPHFSGSHFIMRHELGHVFGLTAGFPPATGLVTEDYKYFVGSRAVAAFREGGGDPTLPGIPMNGSHWDGSVGPELMIGSDRDGFFADEISVAALADAGYTVDMSVTTPWSSRASTVASEPVSDIVIKGR